MISTTTSFVTYIASGITGTFVIPFRFLLTTDIRVWVSTPLTGTAEVTEFNVVSDGLTGGTVSLTSVPAAGDVVLIRRVVHPTQMMNYIANDNFPAESHEGALDKLTMLVQQLIDGGLARNIAFPSTDPLTLVTMLPEAVSRANTILTFDADGQMGCVSLATLIASIPALSGTVALASGTPTGSSLIKTVTITTGITGQYQQLKAWLIDSSTPTTTKTVKAPSHSRFAEWNVITDINGSVTLTVDNTSGPLQTWYMCIAYMGQVIVSQPIILGT